MTAPEDEFARELEVFRSEAEEAICFFYAYFAIQMEASRKKDVLRILNQAPYFWMTVQSALQTSALIVLGRIFDEDSNHNMNRILKIGQSHIEMFSKTALADRKRKVSTSADEWLPEYLDQVYVPVPDDFRRLRKHVAKRRQIYNSIYHNLRNKVFAHKEISDKAIIQGMFQKIKVSEFQQLLVFPMRLQNALWELFHNGHKPVLRPVRYSGDHIRKQPSPQFRPRELQELLICETRRFLGLLSELDQRRSLENTPQRRVPKRGH